MLHISNLMAEEKTNSKPASFVITLDDYIAAQQKEPAIADKLVGKEIEEAIRKVAENFGIDVPPFSYAIEFCVLKKDWAVYLPEIFEANLNFDPIFSRELAVSAAAELFPKFGNRFDAPAKYVSLWRTRPVAPVASGKAVDLVLERAKSLASPKLCELLETRFKEVRNDAQVLKTLIEKKEKGGLGFSAKQAEMVMRLISFYAGNILSQKNVPLPPVLKAEEAPRPPVKAIAPTAAKKEILMAKENEAEVAAVVRKAVPTAPGIKSVDDLLKERISKIIGASNIRYTDLLLSRRFEAIILARLRDVRDETETKEMLERPEKVGGLGMDVARSGLVLRLLAEAFAEVNTVYKKNEEENKQKFVREQAEREALRRADRERREREEREKLYARVTGIGPTIKSIKRPTPAGLPSGVSAVQQGAATVVEPKAATAVPQAPTVKPRVEEVKFAPKVSGPIEELRQMTLEEFHRLSKDPQMAVQKIKDKLELLGDEDFTRRVEGIKAWQESGVNRHYFALLKDSLMRGVPPAGLIEEYAKAGKATITKDEFTAIMELNRDLRF